MSGGLSVVIELHRLVDERLRHEIADQGTAVTSLRGAACIIITATNCSLGSTQKVAPHMPAQLYSPGDPGIGLRPSWVRTTNPSPKPCSKVTGLNAMPGQIRSDVMNATVRGDNSRPIQGCPGGVEKLNTSTGNSELVGETPRQEMTIQDLLRHTSGLRPNVFGLNCLIGMS